MLVIMFLQLYVTVEPGAFSNICSVISFDCVICRSVVSVACNTTDVVSSRIRSSAVCLDVQKVVFRWALQFLHQAFVQ